MKTPAAMQNAIGCVAVLFFPRIPVSFALFLLLLSFSFTGIPTQQARETGVPFTDISVYDS